MNRLSLSMAAFVVAGLLCLFTFPTPAEATPGVSSFINIQGKVTNTDGTNVADGVYDFVFKLYDGVGSGATNTFTEEWEAAALFSSTMSSAPGSAGESSTYSSDTNESSLKTGQLLWNVTKGEAVRIVSVNTGSNVITHSPTAQAWNNSDTITNQIYVKDGIFQVALNSLNVNWGTTDFSDDSIFLGIEFDGDGEMVPRSQFNSVPYAYRAESAESADVANSVVGLSIAGGKNVTFNNTLTFNGTDSTAFTLPGANDTLVGLAANQALTNKTVNGLTITSSTGTLTITNGKTLSASNTLTFTGTDGSSVAFGTGGTVCYTGGGCSGAVSADSLDFGELMDSMTLDATTDIALGGYNLTTSGTGTLSFANTGGVSIAGNVTVAADMTVKLTGGTSFPGSPSEGEMFYRTDIDQLYIYTGSKWQADRSTATLIVAASDSLNKEKADYVADGTGDQSEIESAISALPAGGGAWLFCSKVRIRLMTI